MIHKDWFFETRSLSRVKFKFRSFLECLALFFFFFFLSYLIFFLEMDEWNKCGNWENNGLENLLIGRTSNVSSLYDIFVSH